MTGLRNNINPWTLTSSQTEEVTDAGTAGPISADRELPEAASRSRLLFSPGALRLVDIGDNSEAPTTELLNMFERQRICDVVFG